MSEEILYFRLSLGYGTGPDRMDGVFYGVEYFFSKYLQILFDNDVEQTSGAVRLSTAGDLVGNPLTMAFTAKTVFKEKTPVFTFSTSRSYDLKKNDRHTEKHIPEKIEYCEFLPDSIENTNLTGLKKNYCLMDWKISQ
jgi:hypothetical protein